MTNGGGPPELCCGWTRGIGHYNLRRGFGSRSRIQQLVLLPLPAINGGRSNGQQQNDQGECWRQVFQVMGGASRRVIDIVSRRRKNRTSRQHHRQERFLNTELS